MVREHGLAELAQIDFSRDSVDSVLERVAHLAKRVLEADAVSMTLVRARGKPATVVATDELANALDESQYENGYGPCLDAAGGGEILHVTDVAEETRWPGYLRQAAALGVGSSLSVPVPVRHPLTAALNNYATRPHGFDGADLEAARTLASYAGVAIGNIFLFESTREMAEQLTQAMESRAVIEQAKGILIAERRCSSEEAFTLLADISQRSNRKLRDVAQALVHSAQAEPAGGVAS